MYEIQLRMSVHDVELAASAIERDINGKLPDDETTDLDRIAKWFRYRLAKARLTTTTPDTD